MCATGVCPPESKFIRCIRSREIIYLICELWMWYKYKPLALAGALVQVSGRAHSPIHVSINKNVIKCVAGQKLMGEFRLVVSGNSNISLGNGIYLCDGPGKHQQRMDDGRRSSPWRPESHKILFETEKPARNRVKKKVCHVYWHVLSAACCTLPPKGKMANFFIVAFIRS